jgi:alpha-L-rhamnosidase
MVLHEDEPATTVWELWDSPKGNPEMDSRNHIMFGTISSWFFKFLVGIQPIEAGYTQFSIRPTGQGTLNHTAAEIVTPYGTIQSFWTHNTNNHNTSTYNHRVSLPVGTNATLLIPVASMGTTSDDITITEGEIPIWKEGIFIRGVPGIVSAVKVDLGVEFQLLNGVYDFCAFATIKISPVFVNVEKS